MKPYNKKKREKRLSGIIEIRAEELGSKYSSELLVKKFNKKVRNDGIMDEARDRRYFKKPSERRTERLQERQRVINKVNHRRNELLNFTGQRKPTKSGRNNR